MGLTKPRPHQVDWKESKKRKVARVMTSLCLAAASCFIISLAIIGDVYTALSILFFYFLVNFVLHFAHDHVWNKIKWGR
jgi:uncharacterized membrane protein